MSIKGFNIDGNVEKYDYESLENKPSHTASEIDEVLDKIANADLEKGTIKELDVVDLITCESGVYLTGKIIYRKSTISQPFTEWMPMKALLIVSKNGYETYFQWIGSAYILAGLSNAEGEFENEFIKYEFSSFATKDYVNKLIEDIESGEEGKDGKSAYQIALDNGFEGTEEEWLESLNGSDGFSPIAKVEQTDKGAAITITDKNETTNATVLNGKDGISVTVSKVTESTADGGSNVVTFSDGKTLTIKNGSKGSKGADGYTPKKGVDYYTEEDKAEMVNDVKNVCVAKNQGSENVGKILIVGADGNLTLGDIPENISGDVIGVIDENNNIIVNGNLDSGTYVFKYEGSDGTYSDIGSLVVGGVAQYSITATLTECTGISGNATVINEGGTVTLKYAAKDGFVLNNTISVNGASYTWDATTGTLVLSNPISDITIAITATKNGYTNIIDTVGYTDGYRLSTSSGSLSEYENYITTGLITVPKGDTTPVTIRTKGVNFNKASQCAAVLYDSTGTTKSSSISLYNGNTAGWNDFTWSFDADGNMTMNYDGKNIMYIKICGYGSGANLIVTINEEINY